MPIIDTINMRSAFQAKSKGVAKALPNAQGQTPLAQGTTQPDSVRFGNNTPAKLSYNHVKTIEDPFFGKIEVYQFSNGMKFYGIQRKDVPLVSFGELYNTGAVNETTRNNGVSHFLEHLIFKGTPNVKPGEFDRALENLGAGVNAWTFYDATFYYMYNTPKEALKEAIKVRAEVVQNAMIPPEELQKERFAVIEEINRAKNQKSTKIWEKLFESVWPDHPYKRTVLGPRSIIKNINRDEILKYYAKHYGPENRSILAVGDFEMKEVLDTVAQEYNKPFPPQGADRKYPKNLSELPDRPYNKPLSTKGTKTDTMIGDKIGVAIMGQGFEGPRPNQSNTEKPLLALQLLATILGGSQSSRLNQKLVEKDRAAMGVSMELFPLKERSMMYAFAQTQPENLEKVKTSIREELGKVAKEGVTQDELEKARNIWKSQHADETETQFDAIGALAFSLGFGELGKTTAAKTESLRLINEITPDDLKAAAQTFLKPEAAKTVSLVPQSYAREIRKKSGDGGGVRFGGQLSSLDKSTTLPGGTELIVREKPGSQKTAISVQIKGGNRADNGTPGLTDFMAEVMARGTNKLSATALQERLDKKGLAFNIASGEDSLFLSIVGLSEFKEEMIGILSDVVNNPAFKEEEFAFVKQTDKQLYEAQQDTSPKAIIQENLMNAMFPEGHPYGVTTNQTIKQSEKLTAQNLKDTYKTLFQRPNMTISMVGDVTQSEAVEKAKTLIAGLPESGVTVSAVPKNEIPENKILTRAKEGLSQAEIMRGWMAPDIKDADRVPMMMLNAVLRAGMSGRLFQTFREKEEALCYEVSTTYIPLMEGGIFKFYIGTDPVNIKKVLNLFQKEVEKLVNTTPTDEEMKRSKLLLKSSFMAGTQSSGAVSHYLANHRGLDVDSIEEIAEKLDAVTPEDVQRVAKKYLTKPSITTVLAPTAALEKSGLPVNGEAKALTP